MKIRKCFMSFKHDNQNVIITNISVFFIDFVLPLVIVGLTCCFKRRRQGDKIQNTLILVYVISMISSAPHWSAVGLVLFGNVSF
jgi:thiamine transporter ThiT